MRFLGDSTLAQMLVFAAILSWSGANICWIMAGKPKDKQGDWRELLYLVGVLILLLLAPPFISGPEEFEVAASIFVITPMLWCRSYWLAKRHKSFWEKRFKLLMGKLPKRRNRHNSN